MRSRDICKKKERWQINDRKGGTRVQNREKERKDRRKKRG